MAPALVAQIWLVFKHAAMLPGGEVQYVLPLARMLGQDSMVDCRDALPWHPQDKAQKSNLRPPCIPIAIRIQAGARLRLRVSHGFMRGPLGPCLG